MSAKQATDTSGKAPLIHDDVPDPEEDDLDDLDDMLDEFSNTSVSKPQDVSRKLEPAPVPALQESDKSDAAADEFSKQLRDQMAALMGNVDESPEMKTEIEAMMRELGVAADPGTPSESKDEINGKVSLSNTEEPFQETIRKTMERMQASGDQATAAAKTEDSDDMLSRMLKEMQDGGLEGVGDDEGFNKMLVGMMEQLTNKEILYEPMKELHNKFPRWMSDNRSSTSADDLRRYDVQQRLVGEIVERFEQTSYSDSHKADREFIVERMQQMQAAGSPPADLVGDMNAAQDALGDIDSGCAQQ
ncbi:hypothetical protein HO133_010641 [Letharia lupina]|uniref:Pex19-domain-containing protein n=1 Tax=Letharia lupina TaxID=560253 RepID=A0A8H6CIH5_9LECA|nr:uncharacterized protein HO133_010641 [Letharia lupina]KAF6224067.1 hypothetical protein HO133_010641 [Letharia lupina]